LYKLRGEALAELTEIYYNYREALSGGLVAKRPSDLGFD
jgi:hypothetical protein